MTRSSLRAFLVAAVAGTAAACSTTNVAPPEAKAAQQLVLEDYFKGRTTAWGVFQERDGTLIRQFKVDIDGTWDGNVLTLDERFDYADGVKEQRIWKIRKTGPNTYEGTAGDVRGVARGLVQGNQLSWIYDVDLKIGERTVLVTFDDRMWLQPDGVLINRAKVKKFGIVFGEATIVFQSPNK
jgi:Protein of unknown function (DUF3833)